MRSTTTTVFYCLGLSLITAIGVARAQSTPEPVPDPQSIAVTCNANTRANPPALSALLPCDVPTKSDNSSDEIQQSFDTFSWQSFVALNWPQDGQTIGKGNGPGGDAPASWAGWMDALTMMNPNPPAWGTKAPLPAACQRLSDSASAQTPVLSSIGKTMDLLTADNQPFNTGPLIDQNGNYTRFQILINKPMYDFIIDNHLNTKAGQAAYVPTQTPPNRTSPTMNFPGGFQSGPSSMTQPVATAPGYEGAIMLKTAFKLLGANDDPAKFHTIKAFVYTAGATPQQDICSLQTVGMVGMHIGNKVQRFPQWVWSTFEHVRNDPSVDDIAAGNVKGPYNYYNPACSAASCPPNQPPPRPWNPAVQPFPGGYKTQVVRLIPINESYKRINTQWQAPLANTVWANYELIGTQWPTQQDNQGNPTGFPFPRFMANTTMETYIQGTVPQSSSSCIACHNNAVDTAGHPSDFTFVLERATQ
ncbi:hypothetical protein [Rhizobium sp.]|jgi:hypothetical protein|uniref:hypothetical protein n=1 Tax=Rhizobium sp. TaxID=391 RepID=UPI002AA8C614